MSKINDIYYKHDCRIIHQGDILRDISFNYILSNDGSIDEISLPYSIIISQSCDLEQFQAKVGNRDSADKIFNQFLPTLCIMPAFPAEILRSGNHLEDLYDIKHDNITSKQWKILKQNKDERYHFFSENLNLQIPEMACDFKHYFTVGYDVIVSQFKDVYLASMSELFRERLSQRFTNYFSRIGLPEIG